MMERLCQIEANYKHGKEALTKSSAINDFAQVEAVIFKILAGLLKLFNFSSI